MTPDCRQRCITHSLAYLTCAVGALLLSACTTQQGAVGESIDSGGSMRDLRRSRPRIVTVSDSFADSYLDAKCTTLKVLQGGKLYVKLMLTTEHDADLFVSFINDGIIPGCHYNEPSRKSALSGLGVSVSSDDGNEYGLVSYSGLGGAISQWSLGPPPAANLKPGKPLYVTMHFSGLGDSGWREYGLEPYLVNLPVFVYTLNAADRKWKKATQVDIQVGSIHNVLVGNK